MAAERFEAAAPFLIEILIGIQHFRATYQRFCSQSFYPENPRSNRRSRPRRKKAPLGEAGAPGGFPCEGSECLESRDQRSVHVNRVAHLDSLCPRCSRARHRDAV